MSFTLLPEGLHGAHRPRAIDVRTERLIAVMLIGFSLAVVLPKVRDTPWGSANTKSRIATVESLVHEGTFAIDNTPFNKTMDRIKVDGKLYSSKPPMLPVLMAGVYWVLHKTTGVSLQDDRKHNAAHRLLSLFVGGGALLALLIFLYRLVCLLTPSPTARLVALASGGLAEFGAGYAVDVNNHLPAAAVGMAALYFATAIRRSDGPAPPHRHVLAGALLGLLPTFDIPSALLSACLFVWLFLHDRKQTLRLVLPAALVPVALHLWLTWLYMGGILPAQMRPDVWEKHGAGNSRAGWWVYTLHTLVGHHGIFAMVPLLIPASWGAIVAVRSKSWLRSFAGIVFGVFVVTVLFYTVRTRNWGGECVGFRWLIPVIAWMMPLVAVFLDALPRPLPRVWMALLPVFFALGTAQLLSAVQNPWQASGWQRVLLEAAQSFQPAAPPPDRNAEREKRERERVERRKRELQRRSEAKQLPAGPVRGATPGEREAPPAAPAAGAAVNPAAPLRPALPGAQRLRAPNPAQPATPQPVLAPATPKPADPPAEATPEP